MPLLRIDPFGTPTRNERGGYELVAHAGLQNFIVEIDSAVTEGLTDSRARAMLRSLFPHIERTAAERHEREGGIAESQGPGELAFRIIVNAADLDSVSG